MPRQSNLAEERSTERTSFRVKPRIKSAIQRAAALSGVDDSVFAMTAAYKAALDMIALHDRTMLMPEDYEAFFTALDHGIKPNAKLQAALDRHAATIVSRP
jgi:uncharacterized protein (DUF1778 family)